MGIYNVLSLDQHVRHPAQPGHKVQHSASGSTPSVGLGYPDLFIQIKFKSDSKTKLINPANVWSKDVIILIAPFNQGLSDEFHAATIRLDKRVEGPILHFSFVCSVRILGEINVHVGIEKYFGVDTKVPPHTGFVKVIGWLNSVTGEGDFNSYKEHNFERLRVDN